MEWLPSRWPPATIAATPAGLARGPVAGQEERAAHAFGGQRLQDAGQPGRVGSGVERQRHHRSGARDHFEVAAGERGGKRRRRRSRRLGAGAAAAVREPGRPAAVAGAAGLAGTVSLGVGTGASDGDGAGGRAVRRARPWPERTAKADCQWPTATTPARPTGGTDVRRRPPAPPRRPAEHRGHGRQPRRRRTERPHASRCRRPAGQGRPHASPWHRAVTQRPGLGLKVARVACGRKAAGIRRSARTGRTS